MQKFNLLTTPGKDAWTNFKINFKWVPAAPILELNVPIMLLAAPDKFNELAVTCVGFPSEPITVTSPPEWYYSVY